MPHSDITPVVTPTKPTQPAEQKEHTPEKVASTMMASLAVSSPTQQKIDAVADRLGHKTTQLSQEGQTRERNAAAASTRDEHPRGFESRFRARSGSIGPTTSASADDTARACVC